MREREAYNERERRNDDVLFIRITTVPKTSVVVHVMVGTTVTTTSFTPHRLSLNTLTSHKLSLNTHIFEGLSPCLAQFHRRFSLPRQAPTADTAVNCDVIQQT